MRIHFSADDPDGKNRVRIAVVRDSTATPEELDGASGARDCKLRGW